MYFGLFLAGGIAYLVLELLWRRRTHWSMAIIGGAAFLLLFHVFTAIGPGFIVLKALLGSLLITSVEFIGGAIVNVALKWNVWDYSSRRYNLYGQICLEYSLLWALLSVPVAYAADAVSKYLS